jgi:hypothetical protein
LGFGWECCGCCGFFVVCVHQTLFSQGASGCGLRILFD